MCSREVVLEKYQSCFERRLEYETHAQTAFVRADARKTLRLGQYARSRVLRNPTVGELLGYVRKSISGVRGGRGRGFGGHMVLIGSCKSVVN